MNHRDPFLVEARDSHHRCFYCGKFVALDSIEVGSLLIDTGFGTWEDEDEEPYEWEQEKTDQDILFFHKQCKSKEPTK